MKKKYWIIIVLITILGVITYNYVFQSHRDIEAETSAFKIEAKTLISDFKKNTAASENKYLNKTIKVIGIVSEINTLDLTIEDAIFCSFNKKTNLIHIKPNTKISVKGRCIGYDELLEEVKLDQCSVSE